MKWFVLLLLFMMNINIYAYNEWEETFNAIGVPQALICVDSNYLYTVTTQGTPNRLYKSSDKGKNWQLMFDKLPNAEFCNDMSVPDTMNLFIIFDKGNMYKSSDCGKSFEQIILSGINYISSIAMYNKDIGVLEGGAFITFDGWKTYDKFLIEKKYGNFSYNNPHFINDSILYSVVYATKGSPYESYLLKLNIKTKEYELNYIDKLYEGIRDLSVINDRLLFVCGNSNALNGGSGHDAIHKSTDGGKTWKRVLDLYADQTKFNTTNNQPPPFGLQSIAFKDSLTGLAVGQFGKIVYTYDGGESWIYEKDLPPSIKEYTPATMIVRYAGSLPILATYSGRIYRLLKDNLAPKAEDIYSISGRVWEGTKGQPGIPVALGYRVTMTEENGDYKFTRLAKGSYSVKALNKYFDGPNPDYYYKPFDYTPLQYNIDLTHDTTGFDFNAIDLRSFFSVSGNVRDTNGDKISGIEIQIGDSTTTTNSNGFFISNKIESKKQYVTPMTEGYNFTPKYYYINLINNIDTLNFTASPVTDVREEKQDKEKIVIYPNPVGDYLEINFGAFNPTLKRGVDEGSDIEIFDMLGVIVLTVEQTSPSFQRIDVSILSPGMYFIKIRNKVEKLVKM